jgi:hypothetical protein
MGADRIRLTRGEVNDLFYPNPNKSKINNGCGI